MSPRPIVPESEISESFVKGSGPGGQKIVRPHPSAPPQNPFFQNPSLQPRLANPPQKNKTSSAVQLKHLPSGLVVKSQATRSRSQNRKIARRLLAEKLEVAEKGPESRMAMRAEGKRKRKASMRKKANRKYRALEHGVGGGEDGRGGGVIGDGDGDGEEEEEEEEEEGGEEDKRR